MGNLSGGVDARPSGFPEAEVPESWSVKPEIVWNAGLEKGEEEKFGTGCNPGGVPNGPCRALDAAMEGGATGPVGVSVRLNRPYFGGSGTKPNRPGTGVTCGKPGDQAGAQPLGWWGLG